MNFALAKLIIGQVFLHACMTGVRMASPLLALREGYSAAAVGVLIALFALAPVFLALPAGRYADRHGLKRPVGFSVIMSSVGAAAALAFPTFPVLCVAAILTGGASAIMVICLQRHVGRAAHGATELRQVFSWLAIGPAVSNSLGPFMAGLAIDYAGSQPGSETGFRAAFAMMMVMALLAWYWIRDAKELPPVIAATSGVKQKAWDLLNEPNFRWLLIMNWLLSTCWDIHTFVVPLLGHERGIPASVIGMILAAFALAAALIRLVMPMVAERLQETSVLIAAMLATTVLYAIYPLMPNAVALGICSVLLGFSLGSVQPMIMSMLHQITPEARHGEALGLRIMAINSSSVLMPVLFGSAGALVGVAGMFWIVSAASALGSRIPWRMRKEGWSEHNGA